MYDGPATDRCTQLFTFYDLNRPRSWLTNRNRILVNENCRSTIGVIIKPQHIWIKAVSLTHPRLQNVLQRNFGDLDSGVAHSAAIDHRLRTIVRPVSGCEHVLGQPSQSNIAIPRESVRWIYYCSSWFWEMSRQPWHFHDSSQGDLSRRRSMRRWKS